MQRGRPKKGDQELYDKICELIATTSMGLRAIGKEVGVSKKTILERLREDTDFRSQYTRAKADQADHLFEEIIEIADDSSKDTITRRDEHGNLYTAEDKEWVNRSKLRVDTRKWACSKLLPKKYGERIEVDLSAKAKTMADLFPPELSEPLKKEMD